MTITSSSYQTDAHTQPGGGRWVVETYTDSTGRVYTQQYMWDGVTNRDTLLSQRAAELNTALADAEAHQLIGE